MSPAPAPAKAAGTGEMLGWLIDHDVDPHVPVWDKGMRQGGSLSRADFTYDRNWDVYICPQGRTLKTTGRVHGGKTLLHRSSKRDCDACRFRPRCCPTTPSRKIPRDVNEEARDRARTFMETDAYRQSGLRRKKIETLFGEAKRNLRLDRLRLRGLSGARDEFLLTATVQNLRRLAKLTTIPPPQPSPV